MTNGPAHYNPIAKIVHWWIAGMIVLQFVLANLAEQAEDAGSQLQQLALLANHKSVGITILCVAIFRLFWRTFKQPPAPLPMPAWQRTASYVSHWTLYGLLFLMPVTGWLMSSASASSVSWFNLLQLPDFIGPDEGLKETLETVHETLAKVLFATAAIHLLAALKHTVIDKDGALQRMSSRMSIAIFAVVVIGGFILLSDVGGGDKTVTEPVPSGNAAPGTMDPTEPANLALWDIDYDASYIRYGQFAASDEVVVKNMRTAAPLTFSIVNKADRIVLDGTATLDRLVLHVGLGEWLDTEWVGQFVNVSVHVEAQSEQGGQR